MVHIYAVQNPKAMKDRRREIITAEINILRKFEGKSLIEDRIDRSMEKLHGVWFGSKSAENTKQNG